ncbi:MAG TPA: TetR/AcrR family transcriptional regulator [Dongiaceae bacterium]|nr:TetR/AcrR family transcriptional regulator [Dongiaceae bacterium]
MFNTTKPQLRSLETRDAILSTALSLFRQDGLDATTMRDIADQAGVALGAAYYYYPSKEAILQGYYDGVQEQHQARVVEALTNAKGLNFEDRLKLVFHAKLDILQKDRRILGALFRYAGEPTHPLSALGPATRRNRDRAIATFALAIQDEKVPDDIRGILPVALWTAHMGMLLYFIYDESPEQVRTRNLVNGAISLFSSLLFLVSMPLIKPFRGQLTSLLTEAGLVPTLSGKQE